MSSIFEDDSEDDMEMLTMKPTFVASGAPRPKKEPVSENVVSNSQPVKPESVSSETPSAKRPKLEVSMSVKLETSISAKLEIATPTVAIPDVKPVVSAIVPDSVRSRKYSPSGDRKIKLPGSAHRDRISDDDILSTTFNPRQVREELEAMFDKVSEEQIDQLPEYPMPSCLRNVKLFDFQIQGIRWLIHQERTLGMPPFFQLRNGWYHCDITQTNQKQVPESIQGSILADDMGLGKTLQTIALMVANPPEGQTAGYPYQKGLAPPDTPRCTIIVCPVSVVSNWRTQIRKYVAPGSLKIGQYYGPKRRDLLPLILHNELDVVFTSYPTLASDFQTYLDIHGDPDNPHREPRKQHKLKCTDLFLFEIPLHRVVLDEAHIIRSHRTGYFRAVCELQALHKVCLTGTPYVNRPDDIYSLLSFLRVEPLNTFNIFKKSVTAPIENREEIGMTRIRTALKHICLRRSKDLIKSTIQLVEKKVIPVYIEFPESTMHKAVHDALYETARVALVYLLGCDAKAVVENYFKFVALVLRIRQSCCHAALIPAAERAASIEMLDNLRAMSSSSSTEALRMVQQAITEHLIEELRQTIVGDDDKNCVVCDEYLVDEKMVTIGGCEHVYCGPCFEQIQSQICTKCRVPFLEDDVKQAKAGAIQVKSNGKPNATKALGRSPKLQAMLSLIKQMEKDEKAVIFSQWTSFLDVIEREFIKLGYTYTRIDGSMNMEERCDAMDRFETEGTESKREPRFILCSLMACGTGINLTRGNVVFMCDTWWNSAAENQAMDRVHRLGQTRPVRVYRLLMKDTVEARMVDIQVAKETLGKGTIERLDAEEKKRARLTTLKDLFAVSNIRETWID